MSNYKNWVAKRDFQAWDGGFKSFQWYFKIKLLIYKYDRVIVRLIIKSEISCTLDDRLM